MFKVLLRSLFSNILNLYSFFKVRDEVSHPYNRGKIIILAFYALTNGNCKNMPISHPYPAS
jgi:hypothetical protein